MAASVGPAISALSCLCTNDSVRESLIKKYKNLRRPTRKLKELKALMLTLDAQNRDLKNKLEKMWLEERKEPREIVKLWMTRVDEIKSEVSGLIDEIERPRAADQIQSELSRPAGGIEEPRAADQTQSEVSGCCCACGIEQPRPVNQIQSEVSSVTDGIEQPRAHQLCLRIKLGERIQKKIKNIKKLQREGQFEGGPIAEAVPSRGYLLGGPQVVEDGMDMECFNRIRELLLDDTVGTVGVYGMGGVGKTTMMKEIHDLFVKKREHFDRVIWIDESEASTLEKIQESIAEKVGLKFQGREAERANELREALRRNKFLLILDGLWEAHSLERIGIPRPTAENVCKLVITTRSYDIFRDMNIDELVEIQQLSKDQAWSLFRANVRDKVLSINREIETIARKVAEKCGRLPLAIITVARALGDSDDISKWEDTLKELTVSTNIPLMKVVISCLELSFVKLRNDICRSCFLYCALYPRGHLIDPNELIEYWICEDALGEVKKISESKRYGKTVLDELKDKCMLESSAENGLKRVKMHDLVRDMAISIMRTDIHCIVDAGTGLTKFTRLSEWTEDVQRVSLMRNDLNFINFSPDCPQLRSLLLQYNSLDQKNPMPHDFFDNIGGLKVLDLSYTRIASLPESLSSLQNLGALLLRYCWNLTEIPSLAKLNNLLVLDLSFAREMRELPHGMEKLINLRRLNISWTKIGFFPYGLLSNFSLLEELVTAYSGVSWMPIKGKNTVAGASIEELMSASTLEVVEINFLNFDIFRQYVESCTWQVLIKYLFLVGQFQESVSYISRAVYLDDVDFSGMVGKLEIPQNTLELHLRKCSTMEPLKIDSGGSLKTCSITSCNLSRSYIIEPQIDSLSNLERMDLHMLDGLQTFCQEAVTTGTLMKLKIINVSHCYGLTKLFTEKLLGEMKNLEEITISHCLQMKYIITREDNDSEARFSRTLQRLKLHMMPQLEGIYDGTVGYGSKLSLEVIDCDILRKLARKLIGGNLVIKGTRKWWESLQWNDRPDSIHPEPQPRPSFEELTPDEINEHHKSHRSRNIAGPSGSSEVVQN